MDRIDDHILRILSRDGRISNITLAAEVGLSPSACLRRVQELERSGIIKGYRAVLDAARLGHGFTAYVGVGLSNHNSTALDAFERAMRLAPEVRELHNTTGTIEYLMRVECPDLAAYQRFHREVLGAQPMVSAITTYVIMGSPKDERA